MTLAMVLVSRLIGFISVTAMGLALFCEVFGCNIMQAG